MTDQEVKNKRRSAPISQDLINKKEAIRLIKQISTSSIEEECFKDTTIRILKRMPVEEKFDEQKYDVAITKAMEEQAKIKQTKIDALESIIAMSDDIIIQAINDFVRALTDTNNTHALDSLFASTGNPTLACAKFTDYVYAMAEIIKPIKHNDINEHENSEIINPVQNR